MLRNHVKYQHENPFKDAPQVSESEADPTPDERDGGPKYKHTNKQLKLLRDKMIEFIQDL